MSLYPKQLDTGSCIIVFTKINPVKKEKNETPKGWKEVKFVEYKKGDPKLYFSHPQK